MADINTRIAAIAGAAGLVLKGKALPRTDRRIGNSVGPHVLGLPQDSVGEAALQRSLQGIEIVIAVVGFQSELRKLCQRTLPRRRIDQVDLVASKQMTSHAADVTCLELKLARELLLHEEVPVVVRKIL